MKLNASMRAKLEEVGPVVVAKLELELIDERAGEDEVKKLVYFLHHRVLRRRVPSGPPENGEHLDGCHERAVAIGELRGGSWSDCLRSRSRVQRDNSDGIGMRGQNLTENLGTRCHGTSSFV